MDIVKPTDTREDAPQAAPAGPAPSGLTKRDWLSIFVRAGKGALNDHITNLAAALAYYAFLAVPSVLLVAVGVFSLFAGDNAVSTIVDKLGEVAPQEAVTLVEDSLRRITQTTSSSGITLILVGSVLALWTLTGAMQTLMWALNGAYGVQETRGFVRRRLIALAMVLLMLVAFTLVFGLLVLGPALSEWIGSSTGLESFTSWLWWTAQWPILIFGLLFTFAAVLYLGPNVDQPRWRYVTVGPVVGVLIWLLASGGFALYVSRFGGYNKAWGSLAAVIILLTWLWISALALLFGAEINAEADRTLEQRRGTTAD